MPTTDPNLQNQALAALGYGYRVPVAQPAVNYGGPAVATPAVNYGGPAVPEPAVNYRVPVTGADAIAEQDALLAAQQQADIGMAGLGPQALPPEQVMSVPPRQLPPEENVAAGMSEPIMSGGYQPAPAAASAPAAAPPMQTLPSARGAGLRTSVGGSAGGSTSSPLAEAVAGRRAAENAVRGYEASGDLNVARAQQAQADVGEARAATYEDVGRIQQRIADEGALHQARLAADQEDYEKSTARAEQEQRELSSFIGNYEPKDRRTTGNKVMSAIAVGLSAIADQNSRVAGLMQGMDVQTNRAEQVSQLIQRGIDRDIDLQRQMLENKRTALAAKGTELGQARERFGDRMDAMKVARAMKLEQAGQEIEALKSRGLSQEATALADEAIAKIGLERDNELLQLSEQRRQQLYANEQRIRAQNAAAAAARARAQQPMSAKEAVELEGKVLDNEAKRRALAGGDTGKPLTAEQLKRQSLFTGTEEPARYVATAIAEGRSAPGAWSRNAPDELVSDDTIALQNAIAGMEAVLLRDESGASISDGDKKAKREAWGLTRRDADSLRKALPLMLDEYNARRSSVGLAPIEPIVRRGAAR